MHGALEKLYRERPGERPGAAAGLARRSGSSGASSWSPRSRAERALGGTRRPSGRCDGGSRPCSRLPSPRGGRATRCCSTPSCSRRHSGRAWETATRKPPSLRSTSAAGRCRGRSTGSTSTARRPAPGRACSTTTSLRARSPPAPASPRRASCSSLSTCSPCVTSGGSSRPAASISRCADAATRGRAVWPWTGAVPSSPASAWSATTYSIPRSSSRRCLEQATETATRCRAPDARRLDRARPAR